MKICWTCVFSIAESLLNILTLGIKNHENHKKE